MALILAVYLILRAFSYKALGCRRGAASALCCDFCKALSNPITLTALSLVSSIPFVSISLTPVLSLVVQKKKPCSML